ncbi:sensor histidine kinase [Clostridium luticellarii]|uniref:sensor histidine kinase n=1 Tax=Clostridium luticellarii TaxID=1691940 RepID=UPI002354EE90|nr:HAMP domain-containing sensor histidine kinase [Clostridium luticellarii]MCI1944034.1 HAMP domain-containing histidine kinase [Clostridium luticellarii]MCI1967324.1 HAMP domain-containing histidine kinase [Clostridium luticellarii]
MFTKLRNRFLIFNMLITSIIMIAAFAAIYIITYSSIHSEIQKKLDQQSQMQIITKEEDLPDNIGKGTRSTIQKFSLNDNLSFDIEVDKNGKILNIDSFVDMPDKAYHKAAETVWNNKKDNSTITLEGKEWRYSIAKIKKEVIRNGEKSIVVENNYRIMFLDVTAYNKTLFQLLTTLLSVALIMLFVIFIISFYFANRAIKPIAEAWEKQKQFVADASHELKTPLSIINANYDALLANQEETIKNQLKWFDYIKIGTDRMTKLINYLLAFAKMESINLEIRKTPFNIGNTIDEVILSMEAAVIERGIRIISSIEPDVIIKSDPEKVSQLVTILLDNAVKYSNRNGHICISLIKSKRRVVFSIKNSGKGIAKQDLPKVFDRFYRSDLSRTYENGSYGLGLSIAKTIIDRLGGHIHVTSEENGFTTFTFTLKLHS